MALLWQRNESVRVNTHIWASTYQPHSQGLSSSPRLVKETLGTRFLSSVEFNTRPLTEHQRVVCFICCEQRFKSFNKRVQVMALNKNQMQRIDQIWFTYTSFLRVKYQTASFEGSKQTNKQIFNTICVFTNLFVFTQNKGECSVLVVTESLFYLRKRRPVSCYFGNFLINNYMIKRKFVRSVSISKQQLL